MVIFKENKPLKENLSFDDVVGLSGFKGFRINSGLNLFASTNTAAIFRGALAISIGPANTNQDLRLTMGKQVIIAFPVARVRAIETSRTMDVIFILKDGTKVEFIRS